MSRPSCFKLGTSCAAAASPRCSARPIPARPISPSSACSRTTSASSACRCGCSRARSTTRSSTASAPTKVALITGEEKIKPPQPRYLCLHRRGHAARPRGGLRRRRRDSARCRRRARSRLHRPPVPCAGLERDAAARRRDHARRDPRFAARPPIIVSRPRLSTLTYAGDKKITRLPRRARPSSPSRRTTSMPSPSWCGASAAAPRWCSARSPRTRNAQVALYQNGDVDFLVATDAIGMGLNLDLDHVAFAGIAQIRRPECTAI